MYRLSRLTIAETKYDIFYSKYQEIMRLFSHKVLGIFKMVGHCKLYHYIFYIIDEYLQVVCLYPVYKLVHKPIWLDLSEWLQVCFSLVRRNVLTIYIWCLDTS